MSNSNKIASLEMLSIDLIDKTLEEIRLHRKGSSQSKEKYFYISEYLLQESMEYTTGAFGMIRSGKNNASISLSRWLLEASLNLLWAVTNKDKIDERLKILCGDALRNEATLLEGLSKIWPENNQHFIDSAKRARRERSNLSVKKPDDLCTRLESIKQSGNRSAIL